MEPSPSPPPSPSPSPPNPLGSVLVVGGCGFVGFHIVQHFLRSPHFTSVSVLSRNPTINNLPTVTYHVGDITSPTTLHTLIAQIRPTIIIHAACPSATSASATTLENVTVTGTRNLLSAALSTPSVRAFIYTSSSTLAAGHAHINLDETAPLADTLPSSHPYARTKAQADTLVLTANQPASSSSPPMGNSLHTACIRLPIVYGERDLLSIPSALAALQRGQMSVQIGDGSNQWDFCSADNAAAAHVLLAKALLMCSPGTGAPKVDGEAFNINDGERHLFWDFPRAVWTVAGKRVRREEMWVIPTWVALVMAGVMEWVFWMGTAGRRRPGQFGRQQVDYFCFEHTYEIGKARERLGFRPVGGGWEEGIRKAVEWSLREGGWGEKRGGLDEEMKKTS